MAAAAIEMKGIGKSFGDFRVLSEIDLTVGTGERVVVCGPSGSGKSTLVRVINRLETHDEGGLAVLGEAVAGRDLPESLRGRVAMVFQQFNLFPHLTVLENIVLGPMKSKGLDRAEAEARAMALLTRVKIPEQAAKRPAQLSGGQQQRVAIARALAMEPEIMLFDEPTSALDPEMIAEVLDVMVELAQSGMTMIVVTHEMGFARRVADRMVFMDGGRIEEVAPAAAFFEAPKSPRAADFLRRILSH